MIQYNQRLGYNYVNFGQTQPNIAGTAAKINQKERMQKYYAGHTHKE